VTEVTAREKPPLLTKIEQFAPRLASLGIDRDRWTGILWLEARENRELLECSPDSFIAAAAVAARLNLEPGGKLGHFWMVPRTIRRKGQPAGKEVVPIIGYRGLVELARRAGVIITPGTVNQRDAYFEQQGTNPRIDHRPCLDDDTGPPIRWYATATFPDGRTSFVSLNRSQIEKRRHAGGSGNSPAWDKWYDAMARKTAIRALWSMLPTLPDLADVDRYDGQVLRLTDTGDVTVLSTVPDVDDTVPPLRVVAPVDDLPDGDDATAVDVPASPSADVLIGIVAMQAQRGLDDHDLAELIRSRYQTAGDGIDDLLAGLTDDQAVDLAAVLDVDGEAGP
jgi:recombination protein RecT